MRLFVSIRKCFDKDSRCPTERKGCGKVDWEQRIVKTELRYHQFVPGGGELRLLQEINIEQTNGLQSSQFPPWSFIGLQVRDSPGRGQDQEECHVL